MELGPHNSISDLRERIDYVLRFSGLQLIFDEFQFVLPRNYSRNTAPARLNWVRRAVMDQGVPAVFVCTPQSYEPAKRRFVKTTGFAMEQFDERLLKTVKLPEELPDKEALAIARVHFPQLQEEYLRYVVDKALATERNFVSDFEKIAALAKDNAREHGRKLPLLADIKAAMSDVLPTAESASIEDQGAPRRNLRRPRKASAPTLQPRAQNGSEAPVLDICTRPNPTKFRRELQPLMPET
jgi:hypothetical protein